MCNYTTTTPYSLCESEREKVHDDNDRTGGVQVTNCQQGQNESTIIIFMVFTEVLTGISQSLIKGQDECYHIVFHPADWHQLGMATNPSFLWLAEQGN